MGYDFEAFVLDVITKISQGLLRRIRTRLVRIGGYLMDKATATSLRRARFVAQLGVTRQCIACKVYDACPGIELEM